MRDRSSSDRFHELVQLHGDRASRMPSGVDPSVLYLPPPLAADHDILGPVDQRRHGTRATPQGNVHTFSEELHEQERYRNPNPNFLLKLITTSFLDKHRFPQVLVRIDQVCLKGDTTI